MNVSELARNLKVTPQELLRTLPEIGFDIGARAIKIDSRTAQTIIRDWRRLTTQLKEQKEEEENKLRTEERIKINKKVLIPKFVSVKDFSNILGLPVSKVLPELMKNGIFTSINEKIDFDTASIIATDMGFEVEQKIQIDDESSTGADQLKNILENKSKVDKTKRPPVIVVMGHVDHGKTSLLDAIRTTDVMKGEAGGITQHIGAYQIERKGELITFIDTPGHEAFSAMRSRGARVADIAILVVAADDGVKPQTIESYNMIKNAGIPFIVAINKIDKDGADINKTKQELSTILNITPEDWGGKTICSPISAKQKQGVEELLDMVLLTADVESDNIIANKNGGAIGTIIESRIDKGEGPVATILIQNGTLRLGDQLCFNNMIYGKVRALKDFHGKNIKFAEPSTPTKIIGLKVSPKVGDIMQTGAGDGTKTKFKKIRTNASREITKDSYDESSETLIARLNIILKTDVLGSGEAIEDSLLKLNTKKAIVKIVSKGLGNITESDIAKAEATKAKVLAFNVKIPPTVEGLVRDKQVEAKIFHIIYDLIDYCQIELNKIIKPEYIRVEIGKLKVLSIFRTEANSQIIGGKVLDGEVTEDALIEVFRNKKLITTGKLTNLQSGKQNVHSVEINKECGLKFEGKPLIEEGCILQFYKNEKITKED
ncbi:translation initiation factor IF-2 [Patescibacteria group bacterium]|nr:translation initiation factor IF-2 [Patescibacteria group bacterium]